MEQLHKRRVFVAKEDWEVCYSDGITYTDEGYTLDAKASNGGFFCMKAVDGGDTGFAWRRATLDAVIPNDSVIRVYAYASDSRFFADSPNLDDWLAARPVAGAKNELLSIFTPVGSSADFYINETGRYLWLLFEFITTGEPPVLRKLCLYVSGDHMADYLPAVYQREGDFTGRFLSLFDSEFVDMERAIYTLPARFDYNHAEDELLRYLAQWVCVDTREIEQDEIRARIRSAVEDFESMYTVDGVKRSVNRLVGRTPIIVESADVDPNDPECSCSELYRKLYGENPYRFFIMLGEDTFATRDELDRFHDQMRALIPAGTEFEFVSLKACIQLDRHSYLGVNSYVGDYVPAVINENTSIHYDTMIGGTGVE